MDTEWSGIRAELLRMAEEDQFMRAELARDGSLFEGYHPCMEAVHVRNAARLAVILDRHGWPGRSRVGAEAADAAWLILQHAIGNPPLLRRGLALLREAATHDEASPLQVATLEDRIRFFEGRPQRYGTQFDWDERGEMSLHPIEEPEHVDERRRAVGLGPLATAITDQRAALAAGPERPPHDWPQRQREMLAWLRRVGWR